MYKRNPLFMFLSSPFGMIALLLLVVFLFFKPLWNKIMAVIKGEAGLAKDAFKANGIKESELTYPAAWYQREADAVKSYYDGANVPFYYPHDTDILTLFSKLTKPEDVKALDAAFGVMTDGSSLFSLNYWIGSNLRLVGTLRSHCATATFETITPQLQAAKLL